MKRALVGIAAFVLFLLGAPAAFSQTDRTGMIEGLVLAKDGAAVAGADVLVRRDDGSYPYAVKTAADGTFRVAFLPPGSYVVEVQAPSFRKSTTSEVPVRAGEKRPLVIALEPVSQFTEAVEVTAQTPLIDTLTTESSTTLGSETIEYLPFSRTTTSLLQFVPGARRSQVWGGSTQQANVYQLDGVNVTDPGFGGEFLLPNPDWIEEFQVRGLGAGAEYGNFQGGLVNMVTKSGTNTFTGAVRVGYEDASLNASNVSPAEQGDELDQRTEFNASVSGPMVKDKLYYFVSGQQVREDTRVVNTQASTPETVVFLPQMEERTERKFLGKLTWQATTNDRFDFQLGIDDVKTRNRDINGIDDPATATTQESPGNFWNVSWNRVFNASNFLEVKYTGFTGDDDRIPLQGDLTSVQYLSGGNRKTFRNAKYLRERTRRNDALTANWNVYALTGTLKHDLKIGVEWNDGSWLEQRRRTGVLTWRPAYDADIAATFDPDDPATWLDPVTPRFVSSDWGAGIRLDADLVNAAIWVQDYVALNPHWTLSAGLRYGKWEGWLTPGFGGGGRFQALDDTGIDPRIGVTWDVKADGTWVAKAHWGRFHQNLFALMFDRVAGGNVFQDEEYWDWLGDPADIEIDRAYTEAERASLFDFAGSDATGAETGPVVDYDQPYVDQIVLSVEHAFGPKWKGGLTYVDRKFKEIIGLVDRNLETNYTAFENVEVFQYPSGDPELDANGAPLVLPRLYIANDDILYVGSAPGLTPEQVDALTWNPDYVLTNLPGATRKFKQVQLTAERRDAKVGFSGSLVWTDLEGNFYSVSGYDDPDGIGAGPFVNPNERTNFYGNMPDYGAWTAKGAVTAQLPWSLRFGAYVTWERGDYYTPYFTIDSRVQDFVASNGEYFDPDHLFAVEGENIFVESRGSRRYDTFTTVDVGLERPFALGRGVNLSVGFEVFNLFNADAVTSLVADVNEQDPADPYSLFGSVRGRQAPRTLRLKAALSW